MRCAAVACCAVFMNVGCGGTTRDDRSHDTEGGKTGAGGGHPTMDAGAGGSKGGSGGASSGGYGAGAASGASGDGGASFGGNGGNGPPGSGGSGLPGFAGATGGSVGSDESWRPPLTPEFADVWSDVPAFPDSKARYCPDPTTYGARMGVFADARGVFVMTDVPFRIQLNAGKGWKAFHSSTTMVGYAHFSGLPGGPLFVGSDAVCGVLEIDEGKETCAAAGSADGIFMVNEKLGYAVSRDRVLAYDGASWTEALEPLAPNGAEPWTTGVWANEETLVVGTRTHDLYVAKKGDSRATPYFDAGTGHWWSVWGLASDDVYAGSWDGQIIRFDGKKWTELGNIGSTCGGVRGIWGTGKTVFFHSRQQFGMVVGDKTTILAEWPCDQFAEIQSVWGLSEKEVYLAVYDQGYLDAPCQGEFVLRYDGAHLQRL